MADFMMKTCKAAILATALTGCSSDSSDDGEDNPDPGGNPEPVNQQYEVTLTNLTGGQVFSEPVLILHPDSDSFWEIGQPASEELEVLAESGAATGISTLASDGSYPFVESETSIDSGGNQTFTIATSSADDDVLNRSLSWPRLMDCNAVGT